MKYHFWGLPDLPYQVAQGKPEDTKPLAQHPRYMPETGQG